MLATLTLLQSTPPYSLLLDTIVIKHPLLIFTSLTHIYADHSPSLHRHCVIPRLYGSFIFNLYSTSSPIFCINQRVLSSLKCSPSITNLLLQKCSFGGNWASGGNWSCQLVKTVVVLSLKFLNSS